MKRKYGPHGIIFIFLIHRFDTLRFQTLGSKLKDRNKTNEVKYGTKMYYEVSNIRN